MADKSRWFLPQRIVFSKCMSCTAQAGGYDNIALPYCCDRCYRDAQSCDCAHRQRQAELAKEMPVLNRGVGK